MHVQRYMAYYFSGIVSDILSYVLSKGMAGLGTVATADSPEGLLKVMFSIIPYLYILFQLQ